MQCLTAWDQPSPNFFYKYYFLFVFWVFKRLRVSASWESSVIECLNSFKVRGDADLKIVLILSLEKTILKCIFLILKQFPFHI